LDLGELDCLEENGGDFLEGAGASRALQQRKPVPMQVRIEFTNMNSVPDIPLVLFFRESAIESAQVAGADTQTDSSWEVGVGKDSEDTLERDQRTALRLVQNFTALRHVDLAGGVFRRTLGWGTNQTLKLMKQAHAVDAYSRCAVLLTTNASIFCAGSEGLEELWKSEYSREARGVGFLETGGDECWVLALLKDSYGTQELFKIDPPNPTLRVHFLPAAQWVSFAVQKRYVVAMELDERLRMSVAVYVFKELRTIDPLTFNERWDVFGTQMFGETSEPSWLSFSRVVVTPRSAHAVAVTVLREEPEDLSGVQTLVLYVCAVWWSAESPRPADAATEAGGSERCAKTPVETGSPSFISVALLEEGAASSERWVVGVRQGLRVRARGGLRSRAARRRQLRACRKQLRAGGRGVASAATPEPEDRRARHAGLWYAVLHDAREPAPGRRPLGHPPWVFARGHRADAGRQQGGLREAGGPRGAGGLHGRRWASEEARGSENLHRARPVQRVAERTAGQRHAGRTGRNI
jgi:hypothetical protein